MIGYDETGNMQNVKVSENGEVYVIMNGTGESGNTTIGNTEENPVPVKEVKEIETTLNASVQTVGTTATTIAINKKVTQIDIANYSEEASVTLTAGGVSAVIGANIATTIKLNKQVENISLISTAADTKVQLVVSGVE